MHLVSAMLLYFPHGVASTFLVVIKEYFSASCKDRPSRTSLLVSGLRFLMQLQANLQNRGNSHDFDGFWLTYRAPPAPRNIFSASCKDRSSRTSLLVSGLRFLMQATAGKSAKSRPAFPNVPARRRSRFFDAEKRIVDFPAMASTVFWLVYFDPRS